MELKIGIEGIEISSFELKPKLKVAPNNQFHIDVKVQTTPIPDNNLALSRVDIVVKELDNPEELAKVSVIVGFKFENFTEAFPVNNNEITFHPEVYAFMTSTSISTTRGVLFSLLKGTHLHKAIIPIIDLRTLIPETHASSVEVAQ